MGYTESSSEVYMPLKDLSGFSFGRLVVLGRGQDISGRVSWRCQCSCGSIVEVRSYSLQNGDSKSCGCLRSEVTASTKTVHGGYGSREHRSWSHMLSRVRDPKHHQFKDYGGRGISVCERWLSFENFLEDMGPRPLGRTLDREDVNGNYEPGNCRWATPLEQALNKRVKPT